MRDPRIDTIKPLVDAGRIKTFGDIFRRFSRTRVALELHISPYRLKQMILQPGGITMDDAHRMADLFSLDRQVMMDLIRRHIPEAEKKGYKVPKLDYGASQVSKKGQQSD